MHALSTIQQIATGESSPGDCWDFDFIDNENRLISWKGKFSSLIDLNDNEDEVASVDYEEIYVDGNKLLDRKKDRILFNNERLPVLDKYKSLLYVLRDDSLVKSIYLSVERVVFISNDCHSHTKADALKLISNNLVSQVKKRVSEGVRVNDLSDLKLSCREKVYFCKLYDKKSFDEFEFIYTSIFPSVKSIKVELKNRFNKLTSNVGANYSKSAVIISIELQNGDKVPQPSISSGMFKTMMILADLILSNENEVIIIDEIENSLGVNCLPDIISEIKSSRMQCIISTHHPRIISDIPPANWQIVSREQGVINCFKSEEIINSSSKHDKFIQLMNNEIYLNGNK